MVWWAWILWIVGLGLVGVIIWFGAPVFSAIFSAIGRLLQVMSLAPKWMQVGIFVVLFVPLGGFIVSYTAGASIACLKGEPYDVGVVNAAVAKIIPEEDVVGYQAPGIMTTLIGGVVKFFAHPLGGVTTDYTITNAFGSIIGVVDAAGKVDGLTPVGGKGIALGAGSVVAAIPFNAEEVGYILGCKQTPGVKFLGVCVSAAIGIPCDTTEWTCTPAMGTDVAIYQDAGGYCRLCKDSGAVGGDKACSGARLIDWMYRVTYNETGNGSGVYLWGDLLNVNVVGWQNWGDDGAITSVDRLGECSLPGGAAVLVSDATGTKGYVDVQYVKVGMSSAESVATGKNSREVFLKETAVNNTLVKWEPNADNSNLFAYTCERGDALTVLVWELDVFNLEVFMAIMAVILLLWVAHKLR